ncbi:Putative stomatin/prohibitin-family membrane protease [Labilithrix luteola]|uniref:Putative stomatin/prohibitin-family membrane protease n=1 Tax=Labilithrix luteola TaxID=1391654 RepID=A0A0K1Q8E7_9BACT|nr:SPFH domain-containing protein [Labilithrix luteola]AKV01675.1 Putative stomatin/prohibitin-family membrane protease [Labilithrix luteola]
MNGAEVLRLVVGGAFGAALLPLLAVLLRAVTIEVEDEEAVLVTSFGKLVQQIRTPGLHVLVTRLLPWVEVRRVPLRRDFRHFKNVHVNDARGTTVIVDLWVEYRIADPEKAVFSVTDWDRSLQNLVSHAATSILGSREFRQILCDRTELSTLLQNDISAETERWGLAVELVFIRNVSLLPGVSQQFFEAIAARLERAKAHVEESGRLAVAQLEADTAMRVAALVAEAKGQYPAAIGRALVDIKKSPRVFDAYNTLYELSLLRPHRTVTFRGFSPEELRAVDAAMLVPGVDGLPSSGSPSALPPMPGRPDGVLKRGA